MWGTSACSGYSALYTHKHKRTARAIATRVRSSSPGYQLDQPGRAEEIGKGCQIDRNRRREEAGVEEHAGIKKCQVHFSLNVVDL